MKDLIEALDRLIEMAEAFNRKCEPHSAKDVQSGALYHALCKARGEVEANNGH